MHNGRVPPLRTLVAVTIALGFGAVCGAAPARAAESAGIAVETNTDGCPDRAEVIAALDVRVPSAAAGLGGQTGGRRLVLERFDGEGQGVRLQLFDQTGVVELERRLQSPPSDPHGRRSVGVCAALAEATAQVVSRYLKELGYHPPAALPPPPVTSSVVPTPSPQPETPPPKQTETAPPPAAVPAPEPKPPPPRENPLAPLRSSVRVGAASEWLIVPGLSVGGRVGLGVGDRWPRGELALSLLVRRRWLALSLTGGVSGETQAPVTGTQPDAYLALRAYPVRASAGGAFRLPVGGLLLPAVGVSLDWLTFSAYGLDQKQSARRLDSALEGGVGYLRLFGRVGVGLRLAAGWALGPRDFDAGRSTPVFRTPGAYLRGELQVGFALGKDS
ncbi:MAG TPA: hypothetical protein VH374_25245 [Polyangia bacterium]|nr:hypothetical protein [Polyangia bacterium]